MRIALAHYHLDPGGVTTVIRQQAALLQRAGHEVLLIAGETPRTASPGPVTVVAGMGYDRPGGTSPEPRHIAGAILAAMRARWPGRGADLLHVHNPTLAKNRHIQAVLKYVQAAGVPLLCQIHDFAEDGRPDAFLPEPYVADCHYAVINRRDREVLLAAGLAEQGVHHLPNPVEPIDWPPPSSHDGAPILYPVRAIRRKNVGEAILLRLFMQTPAPLAITLPPRTPRDLAAYRLWRAVTARHRLPVLFEAGLGSDYKKLMAGCRFVLTTSITEGFGFAFLEPWSAGKALWGRRLAASCDDFAQSDIRLEHLYTHVWVPLDWLDADLLERRWCGAWRAAAYGYGQMPDDEVTQQAWARVCHGGYIDFGLLDEPLQQSIIERLIAQPSTRQVLVDRNPHLASPGPPTDSEALINHNREMVRRHFNPEVHLERLCAVYRRVVRCPVGHTIDKASLMAAFLDPERFSLLKWSPLDG